MNPEHRKYILENIHKKSLKQISEELNIREGKIRKFLQRQKEKEKQAAPAKEEAGRAPSGRSPFLFIAVIVILGFVVYGNSLKAKFVYDDYGLVVENSYIKSWSYLGDIFTKDVAAGVDRRYGFYRPIQMLTYMADYSFWKLSAAGYHFTNILLHVLAALCVYWFINILFDDRALSFLAGAFFVVHPVHTEAVTYISGRSDSLGLIFMLLAFIFYIKKARADSLKAYILMITCYMLALLSRENTLILPLLLLLYHYAFKEKFRIKAFAPILALACIYIVFRATALKSIISGLPCTSSLPQRIPGFFVAITNYIRLLFLPFDLHMEYGTIIFGFGNPMAILGVAILAFLLIYGFRQKENNRPAFFSVYWFFLALLPISL